MYKVQVSQTLPWEKPNWEVLAKEFRTLDEAKQFGDKLVEWGETVQVGQQTYKKCVFKVIWVQNAL